MMLRLHILTIESNDMKRVLYQEENVIIEDDLISLSIINEDEEFIGWLELSRDELKDLLFRDKSSSML